MNWRRFLAISDHWAARSARRLHGFIMHLSVPAPRLITLPVLVFLLGVRQIFYFLIRVLCCEPLFKAYCTRYGRNFHTGVFLHWVQGKGEIIIGDDVTIDGRCNFFFAARYADHPTLIIGDHTGLGHNVSCVIGKQITIGNHCRIAGGTQMFDTPGHPSDPGRRLAGKPADSDEVRPISIGNNVWIGTGAIIYPGVTIGDNSIVSMGSVVMSDVPANTLVAGNPARQVRSLARQAPPTIIR